MDSHPHFDNPFANSHSDEASAVSSTLNRSYSNGLMAGSSIGGGGFGGEDDEETDYHGNGFGAGSGKAPAGFDETGEDESSTAAPVVNPYATMQSVSNRIDGLKLPHLCVVDFNFPHVCWVVTVERSIDTVPERFVVCC
jgi:hypothetical protein